MGKKYHSKATKLKKAKLGDKLKRNVDLKDWNLETIEKVEKIYGKMVLNAAAEVVDGMLREYLFSEIPWPPEDSLKIMFTIDFRNDYEKNPIYETSLEELLKSASSYFDGTDHLKRYCDVLKKQIRWMEEEIIKRESK
jgi:hypothetical protein